MKFEKTVTVAGFSYGVHKFGTHFKVNLSTQLLPVYQAHNPGGDPKHLQKWWQGVNERPGSTYNITVWRDIIFEPQGDAPLLSQLFDDMDKSGVVIEDDELKAVVEETYFFLGSVENKRDALTTSQETSNGSDAKRTKTGGSGRSASRMTRAPQSLSAGKKRRSTRT